MMRHLAIAAWGAILCASIAGAQPAPHKEPALYVATERASRVEVRPPGVRLGLRRPRELALAPLSETELAVLAQPGPRLKTGIQRSLPSEALSTGAWEITSEGARLWRMAIRSPGSTGIRVEFRDFAAGSGQVWLYYGSQYAGPYTGRGIFDDGRFWSGTVLSDSVTLEYEPAPGTPEESGPPFHIRTIAHQVRPPSHAAIRPYAAAPAPVDTADYCNLDPNCYPEWQSAMSMVAELRFEDQGDEVACSGTLVATRDNSFKPYLLTAGHCFNSEDAARTLEAYWTYQTSSCGGQPPVLSDSKKSTLGAHLIGWGTIEAGDYSLLLLQDVPSGVTFGGWDTSDPPVTTPLTGIHHPMASWKRISFGERVDDLTVDVEGDIAPADKYFEVLWDKGRVEPGSSGSALFSSPGVITGTLTYGPSSPDLTACQIDPMIVGYGRFSVAYSALQDYFENLPAAAVLPDKANLSFSVVNHAAPAGQVVRLTTQSTGQITYKLRADAPWILLSSMTGTLSAASPAPVTISIDPTQFSRADRYPGTVTIFTGAADPQFINVTATVTMTQSNVTASIAPNPVVQSGGQWSFKIRLAETAGVATSLTAIALNGTDYSANIQNWFGTNHIPANGSIEAPLSGAGLFPSGAQYFEFSGVDDTSGQHWYRTATVVFQ